MRIVTEGRHLTAYLDGKPVLSVTVPSSDTRLAISGKDEKTGEIILKVVNKSSEPKDVGIVLLCIKNVNSEGSESVLACDNPGEENSFSDQSGSIREPVSSTESLPAFRTYSHLILVRSTNEG